MIKALGRKFRKKTEPIGLEANRAHLARTPVSPQPKARIDGWTSLLQTPTS